MENAIIHEAYLERNEAAPIQGIDQNKSTVGTTIVGGEKLSPVEGPVESMLCLTDECGSDSARASLIKSSVARLVFQHQRTIPEKVKRSDSENDLI
ncbi:hypothetical protein N7541_011391 [Penicillium brevicompactum]|uniref:Uncharacterized protein n=1 Tax=Penicillium brevicompactum TaxID=5074 RepID=A0A9W9QQB8_PENBR|nr:hypothetical protein N7541_011391 [Penicillium brevicompactum]